LKPLDHGDVVRLISPPSTPDEKKVQECVSFLEALGLRVEIGRHALDRFGYLAGRDEDRLADLNSAISDPKVRAIIATQGGKGAYRIADGINFPAMLADPKLLIRFSEITILHLSIWKHCTLPGAHGAAWNLDQYGKTSAASLERAITSLGPVVVRPDVGEPSAALTTAGRAQGGQSGDKVCQ
jgi:muramoyltetrapeptide carboxypeptidase